MFHVSTLKTRIRRRLQAAIARQARRQRVRRELEATSDRGLADIGIARGDIYVVAFGRATRI